MTTVQSPPAPPTAIRPKVVARTGLYAVLAANVAVVTVFFAQAGFASNALIVLGRLAGLYGALFMAFQLVLVARLPWLDHRIGMDRLTTWHRWVGFGLLWTLMSHAVFITFGYAEGTSMGPVDELVELAETTEGVLRAIVALVLIMVIGAVSARYARRRLAYETWHFIHLYTYVAVVLAFTHQVGVGTTFTSSSAATTYWWVLWSVALGSVFLGRVVLPLRKNLRHQLRVSAVVPEADNVVSIYMTGRDLDKLPARAGQFFLWRFLTKDRWWQANPFSLSAAPDGRSLRLTAKVAGDGTAALRHIPVGTRVFAEGPYGAFTAMHRTRPEAVLIAGGVGVTPIRALLEEIQGHAVVIYRVARDQDAVLYEELRDLAHAKGAELHLVSGPVVPDRLAPAALAELVPDIADRDVFLCGPPPMMNAVLRSLRELGVPRSQTHFERFSLAG
ncbi:ferric reductase-like transmembrane domain-containing protein [Streptomyces turgidiscabies]|uniref:Oxidoreductase NAD-binding domain protein n=1 Tax=Streptomyces turgidiscabies (strain Car8) TaxID=698760 RepID=L7FIR1_STRT8|nr:MULTISPECIES: ferredoxin reductase family protein [Streptomyces]ELP70976.1 oxidoreductase NAD-binding domain protein [Streptomyces turgidiscabies Car8]MDX3491885.1 ferredoxin reductase family protein [Streptomyces turgidiscabies]GAQ71998.1 3-ketosteroid-9-alpha-hydroxylase reductase [Streptomyces turgidiscabies]